LLLNMTKVNLWQIQLNGYYLESHSRLNRCLADGNAYQSKNQALRSKELSVELRNRYASSYTSGELFRKKYSALKGHRRM